MMKHGLPQKWARKYLTTATILFIGIAYFPYLCLRAINRWADYVSWMCVPQLPGWSSKINVLNRWMLQRRIWIIIRNQDKHATSLLQFRMEVTDLDRSLVQTIRFHHTDSYRVLDLRWYNCHRLDRVTGHTGSNLC